MTRVNKKSKIKAAELAEIAAENAQDPELVEIIEEISTRRPKKRAECLRQKGPCLLVGCKYNIYLDVSPETGSIKFNYPDKEVWEMAETCSLNIADQGGVTLEAVGDLLNLTRERIRQVEVKALTKLRLQKRRAELEVFAKP